MQGGPQDCTFSQLLIYQPSNLLGELPPGSVFLNLLFSRAPLLFSGPGVIPEVARGSLKPRVKWMAVLVDNSGQRVTEVSLFLSGPRALNRAGQLQLVLAGNLSPFGTSCSLGHWVLRFRPLQLLAAHPLGWEVCCLW